jgi:hypothetical protein
LFVRLRAQTVSFVLAVSVLAVSAPEACSSDQSQPETPYVQEIKAMYRVPETYTQRSPQFWVNDWIEANSRAGSGITIRGYSLSLKLRLAVPDGIRKDEDAQCAEREIKTIEKQLGPKCLALISPLAILLACKQNLPAVEQSYLERVISIANSASVDQELSYAADAASTLSILASDIPGHKSFALETKEALLRPAFKLQLRTDGLTSAALNILRDLVKCLKQEGKLDEAMSLCKETLDFLELQSRARGSPISSPDWLLTEYMNMLVTAHRKTEAEAIQIKLDVQKKRRTLETGRQSDVPGQRYQFEKWPSKQPFSRYFPRYYGDFGPFPKDFLDPDKLHELSPWERYKLDRDQRYQLKRGDQANDKPLLPTK